MARKKRGHAGGHGWFVTFADLMALLMSFFVMLTAVSSQDNKKLQAVAGSMRDAFGSQKQSRLAGIVEADGIATRPYLKNVRQAPPEEASDFTMPSTFEKKEEGLATAAFDRRFALAAAPLRQSIAEMPEIAELSKNVVVEETKDGLDISLVDQDGRAMFPDGGVQPFERTRRAIEALTPALRRLPNRIAIAGHASAARPGQPRGAGVWDLTAGRAGALRDLLAAGGIPEDRFHSVAGRGETDPVFPDNPYLAANRRVTITLLREAPPLPRGRP